MHWHWDHPRIRGEHSRLTTFSRNGTRIIPAYAGSTFMYFTATWRSVGSSPHTRGAHNVPSPCRTSFRDHPRIRGEHPKLSVVLRRIEGIIPAYAGSTHWPVCWFLRLSGSSPHTRGALYKLKLNENLRRDHPRIRGEHIDVQLDPYQTYGIIPAYAGSTLATH